jgi:hypothetical protein
MSRSRACRVLPNGCSFRRHPPQQIRMLRSCRRRDAEPSLDGPATGGSAGFCSRSLPGFGFRARGLPWAARAIQLPPCWRCSRARANTSARRSPEFGSRSEGMRVPITEGSRIARSQSRVLVRLRLKWVVSTFMGLFRHGFGGCSRKLHSRVSEGTRGGSGPQPIAYIAKPKSGRATTMAPRSSPCPRSRFVPFEQRANARGVRALPANRRPCTKCRSWRHSQAWELAARIPLSAAAPSSGR